MPNQNSMTDRVTPIDEILADTLGRRMRGTGLSISAAQRRSQIQEYIDRELEKTGTKLPPPAYDVLVGAGYRLVEEKYQ